MVSIGMQSPHRAGSKQVILEITPQELKNLTGSFEVYSYFVGGATPAYSESFHPSQTLFPFLSDMLGSIQNNPETYFIVTTDFMAANDSHAQVLIQSKNGGSGLYYGRTPCKVLEKAYPKGDQKIAFAEPSIQRIALSHRAP